MNSAIVAIVIVLICLILFITEALPTATTALLGCTAMFVCGICSLSDIMIGFTNDITLILFGMGIFGEAMFESGLSHVLGNAIVKLSGGKERRLVMVAGLTGALLGAFINLQAICVMMLAICVSVVRANPQMNLKNLVFPIILCSMFGGFSTLIGAAAQLSASSILEEATGVGFHMFTLTPLGVILAVICFVYVFLLLHPLGSRIWGDKNSSCDLHVVSSDEVHVNRRKMKVAVAAWVIMLVLFITGWVTVGAAAMIGGLICLIGRAVKQKQAFQNMDWNVLIWLACCMGLAKGLSNSGATQMLADSVIGVVAQNASPIVFFGTMVILATVLSNFIANVTTVVIILPVVIAIAQARGMNPETFAVGIAMAANLTYCTPLANGFVGMTMNAGYRFSDYAKFTLPLAVLVTLGIIVITPIMFPLL